MAEGHKLSYPLQHRRSTKHLINRYESISSSHDQQVSGRPLKPPANPPMRSPKEKSPMRQSIRNLFSVLKKVNLRKGKPAERPLSSYRKQHYPILDSHPGLHAPPVLKSRSRKLTSSLLYLSRSLQPLSDSSDFKPAWMSCTVTLEPGAIVVSSLIHNGNPSERIIELSNCTDVRSLSPQQLDPEESALLPRKGENDEFKVFEILFEGRPREKFAANSVQERAGWVSAVWDTILPSQDQDNNQTPETSSSPQSSGRLGDLTSPSSTQTLTPQSFSQRALPPIPMDQKPLVSLTATRMSRNHSEMSSSSVSPSIYPPTRPASRAWDSRSTRPSIANLSQLSVVRQRLAQIETTSSKSSESGLMSPTSPISSISTRLTTPVPSLGSEVGHITTAMMRNGSGQSSTADSILDSYGDQSLKLPELTLFSPIASLPEYETRNTLHPSVQPHSIKRSSPQAERSATSSRVEPFIEVRHEHSKKNYDQINSLCDQVSMLRDDVQILPRSVASTVDVEGHTNHVLKMVAKLEQHTRMNTELLGSIQSKMDKRVEPSCTGCKDESGLTKSIRALRDDVTKDLIHIRTVLESKNEAEAAIKMKNIAASNSQSGEDSSHLNSKIDVLLATLSDKQVLPSTSMGQLEKTLVKMSSLLEKDNEKQELQAQQQSETVRYLAELNSWLEALVNHDRVQNHNLSVKIDQLCRDLNGAGGSTLIADIRQLAQCTVARDHGFAALQASLDGIFATLNENSVEANFARLTALIDHQGQYQEQLVRALGTEISDEIKGERLRFVEAMKEATAINVQIHVDQFKQELKREVMEMTKEVGRLHQDRQAMQNQIADLFAFYRKQKAVVENDQPFTTSAIQEPIGRTRRQPLPFE